ncbi:MULTISPECIES: hypothetical protein [Pseudomonas]|uniref:hypothetical protein n=1 Tax=Pseudomonas TaxID=286 RepID=UPI001BE740F4|nr:MULTISPECIES: hypothetical protein [Pseudomonas]MBT2338128.1 ABC transporter ATP-binding protein [Pseudomonas fluorescens]MCD4527603.1 hypothetical protein [Pseudomonas sp. C3-2018]
MISNFRVILMGIAVAFTSIASPYLIGMIINFYTQYGEIENVVIVVTCLLITTSPCARLASNLYIQKLSAATRKQLKSQLTNAIIPNTTISNYGEAIDLIDGDVEGAIYLYHHIYLDITLNLGILLPSLFIIFSYNTLIIIAPMAAILYTITITVLSRKLYSRSHEQYVEANTLLIRSISTAKSSASRSNFDKLQGNCGKIELLSLFARGKISLLEFFSNLSYLFGIILLFYLGSSLIIESTLPIGDFVSAAIYLERVLLPTASLINIYYATSEARYRRKRINQRLQETLDE